MCKDGIMKAIEKSWNSDKYRENRLLFERNFKCCGFYRYNPKEECGIEGIKGYLCGDMIKISLKGYLIQLPNISIYLISVEILPILFASALVCSNDEEKKLTRIMKLRVLHLCITLLLINQIIPK